MSEQKNTPENFESGEDLNLFFDNFIKSGEVIKEKEVAPGFVVKLRVLNTGELLSAETVMLSIENTPSDIVAKVRAASILSQAIISINGINIEKSDMNPETIGARRLGLYRQLLKTPAIIVQKTYALYVDGAKDQVEHYDNFDETLEKIKNF